MEDWLIINQLYERSESAVCALDDKYGRLCRTVANRILHNEQDAEECVNDALLAVWNRIPPEKPHPLSAYLCGIVKNISLNKYHANIAGKRNRHYDLVLDELAECLAGTATVEDTILAQELGREINVFLAGLKKTDRIIFVRRYWFLEDVREIADSLGKTSNYVAVHLHRSRSRLKKYLIGKGLME